MTRRLMLAVMLALPTSAFAVDPELAKVPEPEVMRAYCGVVKEALDQRERDLAVQRAYVVRLERLADDLTTKLSITERALHATEGTP